MLSFVFLCGLQLVDEDEDDDSSSNRGKKTPAKLRGDEFPILPLITIALLASAGARRFGYLNDIRTVRAFGLVVSCVGL